jgi:DHA1 family tetracycline resistance protein-like MFS transporter
VSLAGTAAGSLVTGLAGGLALLVVGRIIDGASGASVSVAQAAAADLAAPADRARLFGLLGAAFGVGFVAGPALGSLAALGGPRLPFLLAAALATANTMVAARRLPETHRAPIPAPRFGIRQARAVVPMLVVTFLALVAFSGFEATFALFGARHLGLRIASTAAVFTAVGAAIVLVQGGLAYRVVAILGATTTLLAGLLANAGGLVLLSLGRSWALVAPALVVLTAGQGLVQTTMVTLMAGRAEPGRRGSVLGVQQSAGGLARVVGPALGGALLGAAASGLPYLVGAGLCLLAAAVLLASAGRSRLPATACFRG